MLSLYPPQTFDPTERPMAGTPLNPYWQAEYRPALLLPCWEGAGGALEDVSGNGLTGTLNDGVTWAPSGVPIYDGTSTAYVDCSNPAAIQFTAGTFLLSAWITIAAGATKQMIVIGHGSGSYAMYCAGTGGNYYLEFAVGGVAATGQSHATTPLVAGVKTHVAVVVTIGNSVQFFVNGVPKSTAAFAHTYSYSHNLRIGSDIGDVGFEFAGTIDQPLIAAPAPSPPQIADLYANPWGMFAPTEPKAWCFGVTALSAVVPPVSAGISVVAPSVGAPQSVAAGVAAVGSVAAAPNGAYAPPHPTIDVWELDARPAVWILEP